MLIVRGRGALIVLRHLVRCMLILFAMLAKRHHGRGIALQRQPQHEADQEQFAR